MITWILTGMFAILTVVFLMGKGSFLIAGYNTASKEKKAQYDEKKLCRLMGICMGIVTVSCGLQGWQEAPHWLRSGSMLVTLAAVLITVLLANSKIVRKHPAEISKEEAADTGKVSSSEKLIKRITWIILVVTLVVVGIFLFTGEIEISLDEKEMEIKSSYWVDKKISLDQIQSATYSEEVSNGRRTNGLGSFRLLAGYFENEEFGNYIRYTYVKCKAGIVMETDGGILVVNQKTPEETRELYEKLQEELN